MTELEPTLKTLCWLNQPSRALSPAVTVRGMEIRAQHRKLETHDSVHCSQQFFCHISTCKRFSAACKFNNLKWHKHVVIHVVAHVIVHVCNPSIWEAEAEGSWEVWCQLGGGSDTHQDPFEKRRRPGFVNSNFLIPVVLFWCLKQSLAVTQTGFKLTNFPHVACPHSLLIILTPEGRKSERSQALGKIKVQSCTPGSSGRASLLSSPSDQLSSILCRWMVQAAAEASPSASRSLDICSPLPLAWQWQPSQTMQTPGAPHPPPILYWRWGGEDLWES